MGDPLSVTASIIAVATFGLQSTKLPRRIFKGLHTAVRACASDLDPLAEKFGKWKASQKSRWPRKVASTLTAYIKSSDLGEIDEILSKHLGILNVHLNIAGFKQNIEAQTLHTASASSLSDQITQMFSALQISRQHISTYNRDLEKNAITLQNHVRETIESTITSQFDKTQDRTQVLQDAIHEMLCQLNCPKKSTPKCDLSDQLQDCIERLYTINSKAHRDLSIDSAEAQLITEDIVDILKVLLHELSLPRPSEIIRKRKTSMIGVDEAEIGIKQGRSFKRMRGLLESSQGVCIRSSNWQRALVPKGRRLESQNHAFDTDLGSVAFTAILVESNRLSREPMYGDEDVMETFTGILTLLPKTKGENIKIRASFAQKKMASGSFSSLPTISFHAVIPDNSKVFQLIKEGNLDGLRRMLQDGQTSLTDCDTCGRSLLWYSLMQFEVEGIWARQPHISKFLIEKGADVNSLERLDEDASDTWAPPLILISIGCIEDNYQTNELDEINELSRLLIEAGADPNLCATTSPRWNSPFLVSAVSSMDIRILRMAIQYWGSLLDLEQRDRYDQTVLLIAILNSYEPGLTPPCHFVEISFEQTNLLLDHGASPLAKDVTGLTCLHLVFQSSYFSGTYQRETYRPHRLLTKLVIRLIKAGADVFATDKYRQSPSDEALEGGYERSWREALAECGYSPQEVYEKSGVEFEELVEVGVEHELVETLQHIRDRPPQWTPKTMQEFLIQGIQQGVDLHKPLCKSAHSNLSYLARLHKADQEWVGALKICGYDPEMVYRESGVKWIEPENINYDKAQEEYYLSESEEVGGAEAMTNGDKSSIKEEISVVDETENEEEQVSQWVNHRNRGELDNYQTTKEQDFPQAEMTQYVQTDNSTTNMADRQATGQEIFISNTPSLDGLAANLESLLSLGVGIDMEVGNVWSDLQGMHLENNRPYVLDDEFKITAWMQDRASRSNPGLFPAEEWEPKASRTWFMDFGEETEAWMETNV